MEISVAKAKNMLDLFNWEDTVISLIKTDGSMEVLIPIGGGVWQLSKIKENNPVVMTTFKTMNYLTRQDFDEIKVYYELAGVMKTHIVIESGNTINREKFLDTIRKVAE